MIILVDLCWTRSSKYFVIQRIKFSITFSVLQMELVDEYSRYLKVVYTYKIERLNLLSWLLATLRVGGFGIMFFLKNIKQIKTHASNNNIKKASLIDLQTHAFRNEKINTSLLLNGENKNGKTQESVLCYESVHSGAQEQYCSRHSLSLL